jgi:hypothetical protein
MPELNAFGRGFNSRRLHQSQQAVLSVRQGVRVQVLAERFLRSFASGVSVCHRGKGDGPGGRSAR